MNKREFLENMVRLDAARKQAKREYDTFITLMDRDERQMKKEYIAEHAPFKEGDLIRYHDYDGDVIDTVYSVEIRVVDTSQGPSICFDCYRTGGGMAIMDKTKAEAISDDEQERLRAEGMAKALAKVGDDIKYYSSPYKVVGVYLRSYKGEIYPVYRMRNASSNYMMFATTRDFKSGTCTVVNAQKVGDCQGIKI